MNEPFDDLIEEPSEEELQLAKDEVRARKEEIARPPSWVWNDSLVSWMPPIDPPLLETDAYYLWDEETTSWVRYGIVPAN